MRRTTGYPGKQPVEEARTEQAPRTIKVPTKKNKPQETNNRPHQITITNKFEALRHAETEGNTKHERKDPAPPPIFVPGITNIRRLTATTEHVVNGLNYILNIINDTIITNWNITKH
jgi:hypothetical protein